MIPLVSVTLPPPLALNPEAADVVMVPIVIAFALEAFCPALMETFPPTAPVAMTLPPVVVIEVMFTTPLVLTPPVRLPVDTTAALVSVAPVAG